MGEGRGKLEGLIGELEAKKAELEELIKEYELMLPHLASARTALDEAGITDAGSAPAAAAPQPAAAAPAAEDAPAEGAPAEGAPAEEASAEEAPAEDGEAAPARRSIASLVGEEEGAGDEATH